MAGERGNATIDGRLFVCTCVSNLSIDVCARTDWIGDPIARAFTKYPEF